MLMPSTVDSLAFQFAEQGGQPVYFIAGCFLWMCIPLMLECLQYLFSLFGEVVSRDPERHLFRPVSGCFPVIMWMLLHGIGNKTRYCLAGLIFQHRSLDLFHCMMVTGLECSDRSAEYPAHFFVGHLIEVSKVEDQFLFFRQLLDGEL